MEPGQIVSLLESGGTLAALVFAIVGVSRGWWMPGTTHREIVAERDKRIKELMDEKDEWKEFALRGISTAEDVVGLVGDRPHGQRQ